MTERFRITWSDGKQTRTEVVVAPDLHQAQQRLRTKHGHLVKIVSIQAIAEGDEAMDNDDYYQELLQGMQELIDRQNYLAEQYDELRDVLVELAESHEHLLDYVGAAENARASAKSAGSSNWGDAIPDGTQERNRQSVLAGRKAAEQKMDEARQGIYADWLNAHAPMMKGVGALDEKELQARDYQDGDSRRFAQWHMSGYNSVDDTTRSDKPGSLDRNGNVFPHRVNTPVYARSKNRHGYDATNANDADELSPYEKAWDLGRSGKQNRARPAGNRRTVVPTITSPEEK